MGMILVEGTGLGIAFSDSSLEFKPISLNLPGISHEMLTDTTLANAICETFVRAKLGKISDLTFEAFLDLSKMYCSTAANETITVTLPMDDGTTKTVSLRGCITNREASEAKFKERTLMTVTISLTNRAADGSEVGVTVA